MPIIDGARNWILVTCLPPMSGQASEEWVVSSAPSWVCSWGKAGTYLTPQLYFIHDSSFSSPNGWEGFSPAVLCFWAPQKCRARGKVSHPFSLELWRPEGRTFCNCASLYWNTPSLSWAAWHTFTLLGCTSQMLRALGKYNIMEIIQSWGGEMVSGFVLSIWPTDLGDKICYTEILVDIWLVKVIVIPYLHLTSF